VVVQSSSLRILLTMLGDVASDAPAVSIVGMIIVFAAVGIAGGIAYFQFSHWQSVTQLLKRFQNDVVPVAKLLEIAPLSWLERPNEGISNLDELDAKRKQLENTFLVLDA
jgi:hypothetical protein